MQIWWKLCTYNDSAKSQTYSDIGKEKDIASETFEDGEGNKDYKFECAYCAFKLDEYNDFMNLVLP